MEYKLLDIRKLHERDPKAAANPVRHQTIGTASTEWTATYQEVVIAIVTVDLVFHSTYHTSFIIVEFGVSVLKRIDISENNITAIFPRPNRIKQPGLTGRIGVGSCIETHFALPCR